MYISPNIDIRQTEKILDNLTNEIVHVNNNNVIICGDLNAHSQNWGSSKETPRGKLVNEWLATLDFIIINRGNTCVRRQGKSIVDLTIAIAEINSKIQGWMVMDQETLSDHKYIVTKIIETGNKHKTKKNYNSNNVDTHLKPDRFITWKWKEANIDLFSALLIGYEWTDSNENEPIQMARNIKKLINNACREAIPKAKGNKLEKR